MINVQIVCSHKLEAYGYNHLINASGVAWTSAIYPNIESCKKGLEMGIPDVLLLDIGYPDGSGADACAEMVKAYPSLNILILTNSKAVNFIRHALDGGAKGCILKNIEPEEFLNCIQTISRGEYSFCQAIHTLLNTNPTEEVIRLTHTEKVVLKWIAAGHTRKEIAQKLCRDEETIKSHWHHLLVKFQAKNTVEMVKKGLEKGLI